MGRALTLIVAQSYGRRLSALVLDAGSFPSGDVKPHHTLDATNHADSSGEGLSQQVLDLSPEAIDQFSPRIKFGHTGEAQIVSVKCH
jgi:hypothetical protein